MPTAAMAKPTVLLWSGEAGGCRGAAAGAGLARRIELVAAVSSRTCAGAVR